jgi:hypothetical protein
MNVPQERRKKVRCALQCRVLFFRQSSHAIAECVTENLSSIGFYCFSPTRLKLGEHLTCLLKMPSYDAGKQELLTLQCVVRVVRIDGANEAGAFGVGCQIEGYHICQEENFAAKAQGA